MAHIHTGISQVHIISSSDVYGHCVVMAFKLVFYVKRAAMRGGCQLTTETDGLIVHQKRKRVCWEDVVLNKHIFLLVQVFFVSVMMSERHYFFCFDTSSGLRMSLSRQRIVFIIDNDSFL